MTPLVYKKYPEGITFEDELNLINAGVHPWVAKSLVLRNIKNPEIALGQYKIVPFTKLKGIKELSTHLADAIEKKEKIVIVADYDCDGATACAVGQVGLKSMGANIDFIVPNRFRNGYGLTPGVIDQVIDTGMKPVWILTVDNGIASHEGVEYANKKGIKVLVTDHHLPAKDKENPKAVSIVNPNQAGDTSGLNNMAGCGVIYYTVAATRAVLKSRGYFERKGIPDPNLAELLDLVALGTVADVVKLDDNNRWLVRQGLKRIRNGLVRPGIQALFEIADKNIYKAISQDFGFALGPRINAAGRLEDMTIGIRCLISNNMDEARFYAEQLNELNIKRKDIEKEMRDVAWSVVDTEDQSNNMTRVVFGEEFHEGVIGIVAGRIKETDNCPTIVFAKADEPGCIKGSGRSVPNLHLRDALDVVYKKSPYIFKGFGGHAMAAGLTIIHEHLEEFKKEFEIAVRMMMNDTPYQKILEIDGELSGNDISVETANIINNEVWGQGFLEPVWAGEFKVLNAALIGKNQDHLKLKLEKDGLSWDAIQFSNCNLPEIDSVIKIAYKIGVNEFRGYINPQIMIVEKEEKTI